MIEQRRLELRPDRGVPPLVFLGGPGGWTCEMRGGSFLLLRPSIYTEAVEICAPASGATKVAPYDRPNAPCGRLRCALRRPDDFQAPGSGHRRDVPSDHVYAAHRQLPRLDAGRVRLLRARLRRSRGGGRVRPKTIPDIALAISVTLAFRPRRRVHLRPDGGSLRPPAAADDRPRLLLDRRSCSQDSRRTTRRSSSCARSSASAWAANGASGRRSRWRRCRGDGEACSRGCCRRATRPATCSPPARTSSSSRTSAGARCSSSAARRRCSRSSSG